MSDRICPNCNYLFDFPSRLKKHFTNVIHCKKTDTQIIEYFSNIKKKTIFKCITCNKEFSRKDSLNRHLKTDKCDNTIINQNQNPTPTPTPNNNLSNQINNINNTTNNNITNNTINNIINIQHINPFGFEDVRTIPIPEMKMILSSGENAGIQIIKAIYNKIENKNFYKPNISRPEIACLNTDFNLTIYKCKEFCDALFDRCIAFLHHMLYLCKNEYSKVSIKNIYDNIEFIETTMRTEIYDKKLQNIIDSEFRNNNIDNKDRIKKFIKELKDNSESKEQSKCLINNVIELKGNSNNEYKITIFDKEIDSVLGDPKIIIGLNKTELIDEFHFRRFEDTKFFKFWSDRIKTENTYINNSRNATIGDIKNLKLRKTKIELMLNVIKARTDNLKPGDQINLDVDHFIYEKLGENIITENVDAANMIDLEIFNIL